MSPQLARITARCFDVDGVFYDHQSVPSLYDTFARAKAQAACTLLGTMITFDEAFHIGKQGYVTYRDSVTAISKWATARGVDMANFRDRYFTELHKHALRAFSQSDPHMFAPDPEMVESFKALNGSVRNGVATHGHIETWVHPIFNGRGITNAFNPNAMFGLNDGGYVTKSTSPALVEKCLAALERDISECSYIEDESANLLKAREHHPELITILIHHGRPLEQQPSHIDFQFATVTELNRAILAAKQDARQIILT